MKDTRTVRRSFVKRGEAERQWRQLSELLLALGSRHGTQGLSPMAPRGVPTADTEVSDESCRLCPSLNPTPS
jgi:hypothetical protein